MDTALAIAGSRVAGVNDRHRAGASPWENGYIESFHGKLRDELLNGKIFDTVLEAIVLTERWRREYNHVRPHSALGCRPPAPAGDTAPAFRLGYRGRDQEEKGTDVVVIAPDGTIMKFPPAGSEP